MFFLIVPTGTDWAQRRFPLVTASLIAVNFVAWLGLVISSPTPQDFRNLGFIPAHPSLAALLTSVFTHAGFLHLAGNMLFLWVFGACVEDAVGPGRFLLLYFASALGCEALTAAVVLGALPHLANQPFVGASGAVSGIIAVTAFRLRRTSIRFWWGWWLFPIYWGSSTGMIQSVWGVGIWVLRDLVNGIFQVVSPPLGGPQVGYWGHIGGYAAGFLVAWLLRLQIAQAVDYSLEASKEALDLGSQRQAEDRLCRILAAQPEHPEARRMLAAACADGTLSGRGVRLLEDSLNTHLRTRDTRRALSLYEVLHRLAGQRLGPETEAAVAPLAEQAQRWAIAAEAHLRVREAWPDRQEGKIALIRAAQLNLDKLNRPAAALHLFEQALRDLPGSSWARIVEDGIRAARERISQTAAPPGETLS